MAVEGLTRAVIREDVARNILGETYWKSSCTANGSTTTIVDTQLRGGDDSHNGKWMVFTSGANLGLERQVSDYVQSSGTLTFVGAVTSTVAADTYEMFDTGYSATMIHRALNRAINSVIGRVYVKTDSLALAADGYTTRFDLPTTFQMVDRVQFRSRIDSVLVHGCDEAFSETVDSDITVSVDQENKKRGNGSCKFLIGAGVSNGDLATASITSLDLSSYTHIELWCYTATAVAASDLALSLDDTASCVSPVETIVFPAVAARTWTYVRLALANPELDTAIISIALEYNANSGANTVWLDDIKAVNEDRSVYSDLSKTLWKIDPEGADLTLTDGGREAAGYNLLKIHGGTHPAQMTADTDVATVDETYLVYTASADLLRGGSPGTPEDPAGRRVLSNIYQDMADRAKGRFRALAGVRRIA